MRHFVAIPLSEDIKQVLSNYQTRNGAIKWVSPEQMHLTLKFLGEIDNIQRKQFIKLLHEIQYQPFELSLEGFGFFPDRGAPRVFWAGIQSDGDALYELQEQVEAAALKIGIEKDKFKYKPHVTLGRINDSSIRKAELMNHEMELSTRKFRVDQFRLFQSILQPEGSNHKVIEVFRSDFSAIRS
jgi:RNA 2',3'-cyclic 3'-phosphodiesterase